MMDVVLIEPKRAPLFGARAFVASTLPDAEHHAFYKSSAYSELKL